MICLHFDGIDQEWVVSYRLEGTPMETVRTRSVEVREQTMKRFLAHEKAVANGARFTLGGGPR